MVDPDSLHTDRSADEAARWVLRCERGLTAREQDEFAQWLADAPDHRSELARYRQHWSRLDQLARCRPASTLAPNPDLLAPRLNRRALGRMSVFGALAAAAAVALLWRPAAPPRDARTPAAVTAPRPAVEGPMVFEDGSRAEVSAQASLAVKFSPTERHVQLDRGEAHFFVEKDGGRPFVVRAGDVELRAVGTSFHVRIDATAVEILVTEGRVRLQRTATQAASSGRDGLADAPYAFLDPRHQALVSRLEPNAPARISTLDSTSVRRVLAWQHRLLEFNAVPLEEIAVEFNQRNGTAITIADRELAAMRVTAALRSDNVEGFVNLLEAGFGIHVERQDPITFVLRKAR